VNIKKISGRKEEGFLENKMIWGNDYNVSSKEKLLKDLNHVVDFKGYSGRYFKK